MNRCVSNYAAIILRCQNPVTSYEVCQRILLRRFAAKLTNQLSAFSASLLRYPYHLHPSGGGSRSHPEQGTRPPLPSSTLWGRKLLRQDPLLALSRDSPLLHFPGQVQNTHTPPPRNFYAVGKYLELVITPSLTSFINQAWRSAPE